MSRNFTDLIGNREGEGFFLCTGLDPDRGKMPAHLLARGMEYALVAFCCDIADAVAAHVSSFKPNIAFFEAFGDEGIRALRSVIAYIQSRYPHIPVILDCKRADIGSTNSGYAEMAFEYMKADAVTVNPYFGAGAMKPFLGRADKGVIVLCRTSNPEAAEMQDALMADGKPYYCHVAWLISQKWNEMSHNCAMVVGATPGCLDPLKLIREIDPLIRILLPGLGTQGGEIDQAVPLALNEYGYGLVANMSRAIIYASSGRDFGEAAERVARQSHEQIKACADRLGRRISK